jgi:sec-independent protein translocase protein TatC
MYDPTEDGLDKKPFLEHIEDLRWILIKSCAALASGSILCFIYTKELMQVFLWPLVSIGVDPSKFLRVLGVVDPFSIQMQISVTGGLIFSLPLILYFIGQFILPALTFREKRLILPVFAAGTVLFLVGIVFCYFLLLPVTMRFFIDYSTSLGLQAEWTFDNYLDFVVQMLLAFGLSFELPLVILVLNYFGLVSHATLRNGRSTAVIIILIFAACITPTTDLYSLMVLAVPMYLLYELCVWITWFRQKKEAELELLP